MHPVMVATVLLIANNQAQSAKPSKPKSIASTHAQIRSRIIMCSTTDALIASVELATKILRELACTSHKAPRFLALEPESFSTTADYSFVFAA